MLIVPCAHISHVGHLHRIVFRSLEMYWIYRLLHLKRYIAKNVQGSMLNEGCITLHTVNCRPFA